MASDPPPAPPSEPIAPSPAPAVSPAASPSVEPKKEWAAAVGLMVAFALIGLGFLLFMRNG